MSDEPITVTVVHAFDCGVEATKSLTSTEQKPPKWRLSDLVSIMNVSARGRERATKTTTDREYAHAAESAEAFSNALEALAARHPHPDLTALAAPGATWRDRIWSGTDPAVCGDEIRAALEVVTTWRRNLDLGRPLPPIES